MLRHIVPGLLGLAVVSALAADAAPPPKLSLLIQGCEWAATGEAAYPVPQDFPTATEMRMRTAVTVRKPEDRITEIIRDGGTVFAIHSPSGIGSATIRQESWPDHVSLRLHLRGLEELTINNEAMTLKASVLSHSGHRRLLRMVNAGEEKTVNNDDRYWTEIRTFDSKGKPAEGLPGKGGYFEMDLPAALFEAKPKSLTIGWIDFYR